MTTKKRKPARRKSGMKRIEVRMPQRLLDTMRAAVEGSPFTLEELVNALLLLGVIRDLLAKRQAPPSPQPQAPPSP